MTVTSLKERDSSDQAQPTSDRKDPDKTTALCSIDYCPNRPKYHHMVSITLVSASRGGGGSRVQGGRTFSFRYRALAVPAPCHNGSRLSVLLEIPIAKYRAMLEFFLFLLAQSPWVSHLPPPVNICPHYSVFPPLSPHLISYFESIMAYK